jgi:hypothetical protein
MEVEKVHGDLEVAVAGVDETGNLLYLEIARVQVNVPMDKTADGCEPGLYTA